MSEPVLQAELPAEQVLPAASAEQVLQAAPAEQVLQAAPAEQVLQAVSAEQVLPAASAEQVLPAVSAEQVLPAASAEQVLPAVQAALAVPAADSDVNTVQVLPAAEPVFQSVLQAAVFLAAPFSTADLPKPEVRLRRVFFSLRIYGNRMHK